MHEDDCPHCPPPHAVWRVGTFKNPGDALAEARRAVKRVLLCELCEYGRRD